MVGSAGAFSNVAPGAVAYVYENAKGFPPEGELWNILTANTNIVLRIMQMAALERWLPAQYRIESFVFHDKITCKYGAAKSPAACERHPLFKEG